MTLNDVTKWLQNVDIITKHKVMTQLSDVKLWWYKVMKERDATNWWHKVMIKSGYTN